MSWLSDWENRRKITISNANVDAALSNFPILIKISTSSGTGSTDITDIFTELTGDANRKKIAITTSDGTTQCYVEIERFDFANSLAWFWVKVPSVASEAVTELYIYYDVAQADNTTYIGDTGDTPAKSVWDSDFKAVYHMAQDPNGDVANAIKDSTTNANHGTPVGAMTTADLVDGKTGKAIDFDGDNDCIVIGDNASLDFDAEDMSVFICFKFDEITDVNFLLCKGEDSGQKDYRILKEAADLYGGYEVGNGGEVDVVELALLDDTDWHSTTLTYVESTKTLSLYYDGVLKDTTVGGYSIGSSSYGLILASRPSEYFLDGKLAEVRISSGAHSVAWIKATYYSNWDGLISYGGMEGHTLIALPFIANASLVTSPQIQLNLTNNPFQAINSLEIDDIYYGKFIEAEEFVSISSIESSLQIQLSSQDFSSTTSLDALLQVALDTPSFEATSSLGSIVKLFYKSSLSLINGIKFGSDLNLINSLNLDINSQLALVNDILTGLTGDLILKMDINELAKLNDALSLINNINDENSGVSQGPFYFLKSHGL